MDGQNIRIKKAILEEKDTVGNSEKERIININEKCVFKTKIEDINQLDNSIFKDVYLRASECLERIIEYDEEMVQDYSENYDYNNIIAFLGSSGSGKTSSMKSFRHSLNNDILKNIEIKEYEKIKNNSFELLNIIDARCILGEKSILEIIVYRMYKNFKDKDVGNKIPEMIDLDNHFNAVYHDIDLIEGTNLKNGEKLERLMELSSIVTIKEHITKLVDKYINYMSNYKEQNKFLVISIDNLDLKLISISRVLEEIRKYFFIPNLIILMTVNFMGDINHELSSFIENIIPFNRRIYMPSINLKNLKLKIDRNYFRNIPNVSEENAQQTIINIFYIKLRYIISTQKHYKAIIPSNLSKFIELIIFLNSIKDEYTYEKKIEITSMYYEKEVIMEINDDNNRVFLKSLLRCGLTNINRKSLIFINALIYEKEKDLRGNEELWNDILYIKEKKLLLEEERINLGDIVTWVKKFETLIENRDERKFIEVFKSIYTLRLLEMFYIKPTMLLNSTGFDFIGNYFNVVLNKHNKKFSRVISVDEEYSLGEFQCCFKYMNSYLLSVLLHTRLDSNITYRRLIRSENEDFVTSDDISKFNDFEFNYLNVIGYNLYKNQLKSKFDEEFIFKEEFDKREKEIIEISLDYQLLFVINIDSWLKTLEILDMKYKSSMKIKKDFLVDSMDIVNNIFSSYNYKFRFDNYKNLIGEESVEEICELYEIFDKVCYLNKNKL